MNTQLIIAICVALSLAPALSLLAADHPQVRVQQLPQITTTVPQSGTPTMEVSKADISAGIKRHIASDRKTSSDKKFHVNYRGKDLALDLVKVHDDRLSSPPVSRRCRRRFSSLRPSITPIRRRISGMLMRRCWLM